jgi:hypothetical protein
MPVADAPEQDWPAARSLIMPVLLPAGTPGLAAAAYDPATLHLTRGTAGGAPLQWPGPEGMPVAVAIPATGFHVLVNADHVAAWAVEPAAVISTAMANLLAWSNSTPWESEASDGRRIRVSDSGEGWDAARLLLPEVRLFLERELGDGGRVLVAIPSRHLLVAGSAPASDAGFAEDLRAFAAAGHADADEPLDPRLFVLFQGGLAELVDGT